MYVWRGREILLNLPGKWTHFKHQISGNIFNVLAHSVKGQHSPLTENWMWRLEIHPGGGACGWRCCLGNKDNKILWKAEKNLIQQI